MGRSFVHEENSFTCIKALCYRSQTIRISTISAVHRSFLLESNTQYIFGVDEDHAINIQSSNGEPITDTILDGIITREKINDAGSKYDDQENGHPGKLTFVIQDAIRCNGKCLINLNIVQRIAFIRV